MAESTFRVGGLASGLDTNSIVDKLVAIEARPIDANVKRQAAMNVQISSIADLISKLKSLATAGTALGKSGVTAATVSNTPSGVTASTGTGATPGRYSITVDTVASAAKARSAGFASSSDIIAGGNLALSVKGVDYNVAITAGSDIGSAVTQINQAGLPVSAAIVSNGTSFFLSLTNKETGKPIGSGVAGGLSVTSDTTGLNLAVIQNATNATLTVDQLPVESQSNEVSNAIPGVTLSIKAQQTIAADLVIGRDTAKSAANVQSLVDNFNSILSVIKTALRPTAETGPNQGNRLDGVTMLDLQRRVSGMFSTQAVTAGAVRTLADIGMKLQTDGTLTLDRTVFDAAVAKDAGAVDAIFSTASTGIAAKLEGLAKTYTDSVDGQLIHRRTSLQNTVKDLKVSADKLQRHVDSFKDQLFRRFSQMESLISSYNTVGNFLSNSSIMNPNKTSK